MCGICGYLVTSAGDFKKEDIHAMTRLLRHRGPDGEGVCIQEHNRLALGHTRLKVIDLSDLGQQPMSDEQGRIWITYNGEIYNFRELRKELKSRGCTFKSKTDTEVIIQAYRTFGPAFIERLNGDFAFGLWDENEREFSLYRDRVGIKPVYYAWKNGLFIFASEIKAILAHPAMRGEVNLAKIPEYFSHLYVYGEETLFKDIHELQPGYCLKLKDGRLRQERYFDFSFDPHVRNLPLAEQVEGFKELFDDAVRSRLISDVPLGIYLSGGIDSSYLTARLKPLASSALHTFSLGFTQEGFNEFAYSDQVAKRIGTIHTKFEITESDFLDVIDRVVWHYDEPVPQIVAVPQYYLAREAKRHITVALSGSGGDELFAGYSHYLAALNLFQKKTGGGQDPEAARYQKDLAPAQIAAEFKSCSQKYVVDKLFSAPVADYRENIARYYQENDYPDFISRMLYMDYKTHVVAMQNKDDKMNMAWGVEGRFPFQDHRVVQFALSMSPELKLNGGVGKWVLKDLCRAYFDDEFIFREKQAFPTPAEYWLTTKDLAATADKIAAQLPSVPFHAENLRRLAASPRELCTTGVPSRRMWGAYVLERWLERMSS